MLTIKKCVEKYSIFDPRWNWKSKYQHHVWTLKIKKWIIFCMFVPHLTEQKSYTGLFKIKCLFLKVRIFWEGHKTLRNLHLTFVYITYRQKQVRYFVKFCGFHRIYELWKASYFKKNSPTRKGGQLVGYIMYR